MASLICMASRTFQLCPLAAIRYSAWVGRETICWRFGWQTDRPYRMHSVSETWRSCVRSVFSKWSFLPVWKLTELTMKWEWMCSRSVWVATMTS